MQICFPISKKTIIVFIVITFIIFLIPYILLTCIISYKKSDIDKANEFCLDDFFITELIDKETEKKQIIEKYKDKKVIALTFDDGPSRYTEKLLDILEEKEVKATFFVLGYKIEDRIDTIRRMKKDGHSIGIHGYTHKSFTKLSEEEINYEIETTRDIIENIIQDKIELIRTPYGSINNIAREIIEKHGLTSVLWNMDSKDWKLRNKEKIKKRVIKQAKDKKIILMHDTYLFSVNAVKDIIDELANDGFYFVTIDELTILTNNTNNR